MQDLLPFLRRFLDISEEDLERWAPYLRRVQYEAGEVIFPADEVCRACVIVGSGLVRTYYVHEAKEVNLRLLRGPASAVALASLITQEPSEETVQALSPVHGLRFRLMDFQDEWGLSHCGPIRRVLAEQHYLTMERRLRTLQYKTATERYDYFVRHMEREVVEQTPGFHVASYLGIAPESLSRVRSAYRKKAPD